MKKLLLLQVLMFGSVAQALAAETPARNPVYLGLIIDTSPGSATVKAQIDQDVKQITGLLRRGDHLLLLTAHGGAPQIRLNHQVQNEMGISPSALWPCLEGIKMAVVTKADVAAAMSTAFEIMNQQTQGFACGLLVLGRANFEEKQVQQILRLATAFNSRSWPTGFTISVNTPKSLLLAASQGKLQVMDLGHPDLAKWFQRLSLQSPVKVSQEKPLAPNPGKKESAPLPKKNQQSEPNTALLMSSEKGVASERFLLPVYPVPAESEKPATWPNFSPIAKPINQTPVPPKLAPPPKIPPPKPAEHLERSQSKLRLTWTRWLLMGAAVVLILGSIYLWRRYHQTAGRANLIAPEEVVPKKHNLFVQYNNDRFELGPEEGMRNFALGANPGCPFQFDDPNVDARHVLLTWRKGKLFLQNNSSQPIYVNEAPISPHKKINIFLPADVKLTNKTFLTLFQEEIAADTTALGEESEAAHVSD